MVSPTYKQFAQAMAAKKQIVCEYDGYARELCAVILGHTGGQEKALTLSIRRTKQIRIAAERGMALPIS
jgi:hypothetical protein